MKWYGQAGRYRARCGHLYVRVNLVVGYEEPGHPDFEPAYYEWFVEPDDEDKSYRRAIVDGRRDTYAEAVWAAEEACRTIVESMQRDLR